MTTTATAALLNLLGYVTGAALYAMLLAMVCNRSRVVWADEAESQREGSDRLPLLTALLGLAWNVGALAVVGLQGVVSVRWRMGLWLWPLINAAAFTALGFLPAVVVHALLRTRDGLQARRAALGMTLIAYALSVAAGVLHFHHAVVDRFAPSHWALHILTLGFVGLTGTLLIYTRRQPGAAPDTRWQGAGWALALAVFAVSALHLSHHEGREYSWWIELIGHHASLPLALAILYQDYRFALADIFLKRALALVLLVALACGLYLTMAAPLLARRGTQGEGAALAIGLLLGLWVATALVYPLLRRAVNRFVDAIVLRRADYEAVRIEMAQGLTAQDAPADVLDEVCRRLSAALTAHQVRWELLADDEAPNHDHSPSGSLLPLIEQRKHSRRLPILKDAAPRAASSAGPLSAQAPDWRQARRTLAIALVPTTEAPQYRLLIGELAGGRRLLSDDLALIEAAAVLAARRIDAVRVLHERCARDLHEQEIKKLATEAELRALRAQINPHFLFNALTTIGYLIQAAPDRALATLLRLTSLLRGVLRQSDSEFATLGEEIELIEAYLDIERARFEDRLRVVIDVPDALRGLRLPALLLQPLVENAIKHGIAPQRAGGEVIIQARLTREDSKRALAATRGDDRLQIRVCDTGAGAGANALEHGRQRGVGLANVEQRVRRHFGAAGMFAIRSAAGIGTTVELGLPINTAITAGVLDAPARATEARRRQA